jgi:hypothetical protein
MSTPRYLNKRVGQELNKAGDDSAADNFINRRIALLGKKLAEANGGGELLVDVLRHDTLDHGRQLLVELHKDCQRILKSRQFSCHAGLQAVFLRGKSYGSLFAVAEKPPDQDTLILAAVAKQVHYKTIESPPPSKDRLKQ